MNDKRNRMLARGGRGRKGLMFSAAWSLIKFRLRKSKLGGNKRIQFFHFTSTGFVPSASDASSFQHTFDKYRLSLIPSLLKLSERFSLNVKCDQLWVFRTRGTFLPSRLVTSLAPPTTADGIKFSSNRPFYRAKWFDGDKKFTHSRTLRKLPGDFFSRFTRSDNNLSYACM